MRKPGVCQINVLSLFDKQRDCVKKLLIRPALKLRCVFFSLSKLTANVFYLQLNSCSQTAYGPRSAAAPAPSAPLAPLEGRSRRHLEAIASAAREGAARRKGR